MRDIDEMVLAAKNNEELLAELIEKQQFFIMKEAIKTTRRYLTKSDDEWSIALIAYYNAVKKYEYKRGSFVAFAQMIIKQHLIDHFRQQKKYDQEVPVEWIKDQQATDKTDRKLKYEIEAITQVLEEYGFTFIDLVANSPKAIKTKEICGLLIETLLINRDLMIALRSSKQLPIKLLEKSTGVPRKFIDRYRKYLIAVAEILDGDYPYLKTYVSYIKKEVQR